VWQSVSFKTEEKNENDILDQPDWGNGKKACLWIIVTDTGCGMTEDEQKILFARFMQATPRTHVKYGGSGLGLFISKTLTTLQGGLIGVSSEVRKGSTFTFFVSTRLVDPPVTSDSSRALFRHTMSSEHAMKAVKLHVLLVEDNLVNQKVLKKQLQKFGWTISVVGDGTEALEWLKRSIYWRDNEEESSATEDTDPAAFLHCQEPLDLILMDIEMPKMDGLTCARRIRDHEEQGRLGPPPSAATPQQASTPSPSFITPFNLEPTKCPPSRKLRLPILAVSANARMEQIKEALAAGMDDAICKPFRIPELWPKIRGLISSAAGTQN
jgi:CheY-like chemotaxis protein